MPAMSSNFGHHSNHHAVYIFADGKHLLCGVIYINLFSVFPLFPAWKVIALSHLR